MSGSVRISVNTDRCCGAGMCTVVAPEVFDQSEADGVVVLLDDSPDAAGLSKVQEAVALCPVAAIALTRP